MHLYYTRVNWQLLQGHSEMDSQQLSANAQLQYGPAGPSSADVSRQVGPTAFHCHCVNAIYTHGCGLSPVCSVACLTLGVLLQETASVDVVPDSEVSTRYFHAG